MNFENLLLILIDRYFFIRNIYKKRGCFERKCYYYSDETYIYIGRSLILFNFDCKWIFYSKRIEWSYIHIYIISIHNLYNIARDSFWMLFRLNDSLEFSRFLPIGGIIYRNGTNGPEHLNPRFRGRGRIKEDRYEFLRDTRSSISVLAVASSFWVSPLRGRRGRGRPCPPRHLENFQTECCRSLKINQPRGSL